METHNLVIRFKLNGTFAEAAQKANIITSFLNKVDWLVYDEVFDTKIELDYKEKE